MVDYHTELGSQDDRVRLLIAGQELPNYVRYSVKTGIMHQPSNWSVVLGAGRPQKDAMTAGELMRLAMPGKSFELRIGNTRVQSGIVEDRDVSDSSGTTVTVGGRDWMAPLVKNHIRADIDFGQPTYFEITRRVLDLCGLQNHKLYGDNEANRRAVSRSVKAIAKPMRDIVENESTNTQTNANTKVNLQRVVGKLGGTWFEFLKTQYKKVGLFLWATADGDFVLSRPTGTHDPLYRIIRRRGVPRTMTGTLSRSFSDHTSGRHANSKCCCKGARGAKGVTKNSYTWNDFEMKSYGFDDWLVLYDDDANTPKDVEYISKRKLAEERRDSWVLRYTVSGHTTPALSDPNRLLIWTPDTTVTVIDEDLGDMLDEKASGLNSAFASGQDCFIEEVEFTRSPQTSAAIRTMRKQDLYYLGESSEFESDETRVRRAQP